MKIIIATIAFAGLYLMSLEAAYQIGVAQGTTDAVAPFVYTWLWTLCAKCSRKWKIKANGGAA
jgi:hypothetical protein